MSPVGHPNPDQTIFMPLKAEHFYKCMEVDSNLLFHSDIKLDVTCQAFQGVFQEQV